MSKKPKSADSTRTTSPARATLPPLCPFVPTRTSEELAQIFSTLGAKPVDSCKSFAIFGNRRKVSERDYVTIFKAALDTSTLIESTMNDSIPVWCKEVRLKECTPRYRANLLKQSLPIQRYLLRGGRADDSYEPPGGPVKCLYFAALYNIYLLPDDVLYIFMKLCNHSLHDRLKDTKSPAKPNQVRNWIRQLVLAVKAMIDFGVAHRALILQHCLLSSESNVQVTSWNRAVPFWDQSSEPGRVSLLLQHRERRSRMNRHFPPECFACPSNSGYDPSKVDLWSVGVIAVAISTGRYPYNPNCKYTFQAQWMAFLRRHPLQEYLKDAIATLFELDPQKRLSPSQVLKYCKYFDSSLDMDKIGNQMVKSQNFRSPISLVPVSASQALKTFQKKSAEFKVDKPKMGNTTKPPVSLNLYQDSRTSFGGSGASSTPINGKTPKQVNKKRSKSATSRKTTVDRKGGSKTSVNKKNAKPCSAESIQMVTNLSATKVTRSKSQESKLSSGRFEVKLSSNSSSTSLSSTRPNPKTSTKSETVWYDPGCNGASGNEGGAVDEKLLWGERKHESLECTRASPEEAETQARLIKVDVTERFFKGIVA